MARPNSSWWGAPSPARTYPANDPVAQSGSASTFSVIVAVWLASPFFVAVNVAVYMPDFVGTPVILPAFASYLSPAGNPATFTAQPSSGVQSTSPASKSTPHRTTP